MGMLKGGDEMKKAYTAPVMLTENFRLNDRIAAGCAEMCNYADGGSCETINDYIAGTGVKVFLPENGDCWIWYDAESDDFLCYHAPVGQPSYFGS